MTSLQQCGEAIRTAYREYKAGDVGQAEERATRILSEVPGFAPAHHLLGLIREQQGDRDAACAEFQIASRQGYKPAATKLGKYRAPALRSRSRANRAMIADRIKEIVAENPFIDVGSITDNASFIDDMGLDSLDAVELIMAIEEEFGVEIPNEVAENIRTVSDAVDYVSEMLAA